MLRTLVLRIGFFLGEIAAWHRVLNLELLEICVVVHLHPRYGVFVTPLTLLIAPRTSAHI